MPIYNDRELNKSAISLQIKTEKLRFLIISFLLNSLTGRSIQVYESYLGYTMNVMHLV